MKSKLKFIIPLVLVVVGVAYKTVLAKPAPVPKLNLEGSVYILPKEFLINLEDGRYARMSVALLLEHPPVADAHGSKPPDGYGILPQEAAVRDIVTNTVTAMDGEELISEKGRKTLKKEIEEKLHKSTDVHAKGVLITDLAVQ